MAQQCANPADRINPSGSDSISHLYRNYDAFSTLRHILFKKLATHRDTDDKEKYGKIFHLLRN